MKNEITNWSTEKPTDNGLYLACHGDIECADNIQPFRLVQNGAVQYGCHPWPTYDRASVEAWSGSFKFAKLCVGKEARR